MKHDETINAYDANAKFHADKFNSIGVRKSDINLALSLVDTNPECLELGCGDGRDAEYIISKTNGYVGIDASEELLKLAYNRLPKANFIHADFRKYYFNGKSFDVVFAFASLLHIPIGELVKMFNNVHQWLKNSGVFYISLKYGDYSEYEKIDETGTRYFYFYTPPDIRAISNGKFSVIHETRTEILGIDWFEMALIKVS